ARVDGTAVDQHLVVQMRRGAAPGVSAEPDQLTSLDSLSVRDRDALQVAVARLDALAVLEQDARAVAGGRAREANGPGGGRLDRCARHGGEVDARVEFGATGPR